MDRRLSLPERWFGAAYHGRRPACAIPAATVFATKPALAATRVAGIVASGVAPAARRTRRVRATMQRVAAALGGEAGARLISGLGLPTSPATLLRSLRQAVLPEAPAPTVIAVDDYALRRGQRYGTVVVDLERRRLVDLLPDRTAATLADWLRGRPVRIVARDRPTEYARGIANGAPQAIEVLDRRHIFKNVRELVERQLDRHPQALGGSMLPQRAHLPSAFPVMPPQRSRRERLFRDAKRAEREARYQAVRTLHQEGVSWREIGRRPHLSRWVVRRFASADTFLERRATTRSPGLLDPYLPYLRHRWAEGCRNGLQLWRELHKQGYPGSPKRVRQWLQQQQQALPPARPRVASTRRLSWIVVREVADLSAEEQAALALMQTRSPEVARAIGLTQELLTIPHQRQAEALDGRLTAATASELVDLQTVAAGLQRDLPVLRAALTQPWSNGATEGFVNKIKTIKRQMYGRASPDLLRRLLLLAA